MLNDKYSFKNFCGQDLSKHPVADFNNTIIKGSCFYQEWTEGDQGVVKSIFPQGMTGVTFQRCNLDNVSIPPGNRIESVDGILCSTRKIKVQNDLEDWVIDVDGNPIEPVAKKLFLHLGLNIDPSSIPTKRRDGGSLLQEKTRELLLQEEIAVKSEEISNLQGRV